MQYVIQCLDKADAEDLRKANRDAHLAHLRAAIDHIVAAGPLLSEDGERMIGSLLIVDFADRSAVDAFVAGDPYGKAGLFRSVTVTPWRKVLP